MKTQFVYSTRKVGAGTALKLVIHKTLDAVPTRVLPAGVKRRLKACAGCRKREAKLNSLFPPRVVDASP